jgi:hypothetical protein
VIRTDARLVMYNDITVFDVDGDARPYTVGDEFAVYRGGGPRDGERIGTVTIAAIHPDGSPHLELRLCRS